ncbi:MAG TPA: protein kinase [Pyrinomonadaceae bacterium]|nr:protein kinase [Pyrinomonadaceae bacterium]
MKYCPVCSTKYEDSVSFCTHDGEVLEDDPSTIVGTVLDGQYHVEALLGKGGMGAVYRARHILLGDRVAIKILPPQMRNNAEWLRRFRREGQAARRFRHPNAVTVYDLRTTSEGLIYMVMEYVEGHTLDAELKNRGRLTPVEALKVLEPVMSVLNAAHEMGVVHRDLKPENIMIGEAADGGQPVVKLLDLGIAKMREVAGSEAGGATALTVAGQILGTPYYMSPEQWGEVPRDGSSEIDGRADIYSLGTVFYELIAGRRPFKGLTLQELRREHVSATARPLHEFMEDVPEGFSRAIARSMAKDRGDRQATAGEFANELRESLGLGPASGTTLNYQPSNARGVASTQTDASVVGSSGSMPSLTGVPEGRSTSADVVKPTVMTFDSAPAPDAVTPEPPAATSLSQAPVAQMPSAQPAPGQASVVSYESGAPAGTIASSPSVFPPQPYMQAPSQAAAAPPRRSLVVPIIAGVLGLLLLAGTVVGGWLLLSRKGEPSAEPATETRASEDVGEKDATMKDASAKAAATYVETISYWLEVEAAAGDGKSARVAGVVPLASGQSFKFHFTPRESGYLYIVGPGEKNVPTTFLTSKPVPQSGVKTNEVTGGMNFSFPEGDLNWITLDNHPGTESYTVIFSPSPLASPAFLNEVAGRPLTAAEQKELEDLRAQYTANAPTTDVVNARGADPFVSVKVPQAKTAGEPFVFNIRIEHK